MQRSALVWIVAPLFLAACETIDGGTNASTNGYITELSEGVLAIAAPNQDLTSVRIDPVDGCYVYRHVGPVETVFLPLRSRDGRPICSRAADAATS